MRVVVFLRRGVKEEPASSPPLTVVFLRRGVEEEPALDDGGRGKGAGKCTVCLTMCGKVKRERALFPPLHGRPDGCGAHDGVVEL